jgi:hypothetical protein
VIDSLSVGGMKRITQVLLMIANTYGREAWIPIKYLFLMSIAIPQNQHCIKPSPRLLPKAAVLLDLILRMLYPAV